MPIKTFLTPEQQRFIKRNRLKMSSGDIAIALGLSDEVVQRFLNKNGLKVPKKVWIKFRTKKLFGKSILTAEEDEFIRDNYLALPVKFMADIMGHWDIVIQRRIKRLGLKIPKWLIEQRKKESQIQPGHVPPNKGKRQVDYMSKEAIEATRATRYKKGDLPLNTLYDGAIVVRHNHKERGNKPYKWIRISQAKWKMLHVYNWEKKYGPVPAGHIIVFKNGDTMKCGVRNLQCITRQQHMANTRDKDEYIATTMAQKKGKRGKRYDKELYEKLLKNPELLDLKRQSLKLKRAIDEQRGTSKTNKRAA
jgi:hypothetical protein